MARYVFRALNQSDIERLNANQGRGSILAKRPGNTRNFFIWFYCIWIKNRL